MTVKYRLIISVVIATMLAVMFTACTKENGVTAQTSANTLKTAAATSVAKTATTSAKSTTAAATASASEAAGSQIPAEVTETVSEKSNDDENYESVLDEKFLEKFEAALDSGFAAGNIDLGGRTVIIASSSALYDPNSSSAAPAEVYLGQRVKAAEKKYNFKAEYKTDASLTKNFTAQTMAGLKYADLVRTNTSGAIPSYITNNFIFPLDDYIDFELQIIKVNPFMS